MAKLDTYSCDNCGNQKQDSNHWWKVYLIKSDYEDNKESPVGVLILKWECTTPTHPKELGEGFTVDRADAHLCGLTCLFEWVSKKGLNS